VQQRGDISFSSTVARVHFSGKRNDGNFHFTIRRICTGFKTRTTERQNYGKVEVVSKPVVPLLRTRTRCSAVLVANPFLNPPNRKMAVPAVPVPL
jgi:hypothetical protein